MLFSSVCDVAVFHVLDDAHFVKHTVRFALSSVAQRHAFTNCGYRVLHRTAELLLCWLSSTCCAC